MKSWTAWGTPAWDRRGTTPWPWETMVWRVSLIEDPDLRDPDPWRSVNVSSSSHSLLTSSLLDDPENRNPGPGLSDAPLLLLLVTLYRGESILQEFYKDGLSQQFQQIFTSFSLACWSCHSPESRRRGRTRIHWARPADPADNSPRASRPVIGQ